MGTAERRQREKADRRAAIVDVAERIFIERGLDGTTMDHIAAAAELSKGALYLYFRTKDALYLECVQRQAVQCFAQAEAGGAGARTGREEVLGMLRGVIAFARRRPAQFRLAMSWLLARSDIDPAAPGFSEHRAHVARLTGRVATAIERGRRDRSVRRDVPVPRLLPYLWASTVGVLLAELNEEGMRQRAGDRARVRNLADLHLEMLDRALDPAGGRP